MPQNLASRFINNTDQHLFLTGKAGTGKTTFLKNLIRQTHKNAIVAAPTGIAAINAGGVTLHSLFQLPFGAFIPEKLSFSDANMYLNLNDPFTLRRHMQMNRNKRRMIQELELLVIDEVSMLRADLLDAIDNVLRTVRKNQQPFGGVQMLFIGDLLQLPPVVKDEEWKILRNHYDSIFFFEAKAIKRTRLLYIEFEKIFRQDEKQFINLLNNLRENRLNAEDITVLNSRFKPDFNPPASEQYIFLTTHNNQADEINRRKLQELNTPSYKFNAIVNDEFNESTAPVDTILELKKGAQVMFIKNDPSGGKRFFNGKVGVVSSLTEEQIEVEFEEGDRVIVDRYVWENVRFSLDETSNEIQQKVLGTFSHFPIRLAWAITVHKSQGLTFKKAILDLGSAFAPGQVYVALSRLTSLEGLVLTSRIPESLHTQAPQLKEFSETKSSTDELNGMFDQSSRIYLQRFTATGFDLGHITEMVKQHSESYTKDGNRSTKQKHKNWADQLLTELEVLKGPADKFIIQLRNLFVSGEELKVILERLKAAKDYFVPLLSKILTANTAHLEAVKKESKVKGYLEELIEIDCLIFKQTKLISKAEAVLRNAIDNQELSAENCVDHELKQLREVQASTPKKVKEKKPKGTKKPKGGSARESFEMFKAGKTPFEIAKERGMVLSTIESHLADYIKGGDLKIEDVVKKEVLEELMPIVLNENLTASEIKSRLGNKVTYGEIRMAFAYKLVQSVETV